MIRIIIDYPEEIAEILRDEHAYVEKCRKKPWLRRKLIGDDAEPDPDQITLKIPYDPAEVRLVQVGLRLLKEAIKKEFAGYWNYHIKQIVLDLRKLEAAKTPDEFNKKITEFTKTHLIPRREVVCFLSTPLKHCKTRSDDDKKRKHTPCPCLEEIYELDELFG